MGWLVTGKQLKEELNQFKIALCKRQDVFQDALLRMHEDFEESQKRQFRRFRERMEAKLALVAERAEQTTGRLFELEGKIAAIEATHHKVGYVPVDAFKALSEGDVEKAVGISEQVRDNLKEIVALQDELAAAGNPSSSGAEWL